MVCAVLDPDNSSPEGLNNIKKLSGVIRSLMRDKKSKLMLTLDNSRSISHLSNVIENASALPRNEFHPILAKLWKTWLGPLMKKWSQFDPGIPLDENEITISKPAISIPQNSPFSINNTDDLSHHLI